MKTKLIQTIWTAEDFDFHEIICATPYFEDLIDILYDTGCLHESIYTIEGKTLKELYGENWLKVIKSFSARKINNLICWDIELWQIDVVEVEKED
jgi:predicted choloylglycine hydrolase